MLRNFDLDLDMSKIGKDLKVQLALPNKKIIKNIKNITNASIDEVELNGLPIFTFEIPHKVEIVDFDTNNIEIVDNDDINNIKEEMLIKVTWYNGTKVNWFRVSDITKEENEENTFMVVESKSLPSELRATNVSINKESIDIIEYFETVLYQSPWKLGTVSDNLKNTYRSFNDDKKTRYEAVMSGIETFGAILDWDEENRILNLKSIDDIREFRGVVLKRENYATSVSVQSSSEEIVTRLYSYGNEGLGIENSNPSGMPYIEDFSYFMSPFKRDSAKNVLSSSSYMSDELCHALLDLEDLKTEYNPKIQNLQNMINSAYTDLSRDMLALQEKQGQLITLQALLDTAKSTNDKDLIYQREMEIRDKELEISTLEENIENIKSSIEEWDRQIFNFQQLISTSSFTTELIDELSLFVYEKEFNDDRYIDSQELYEASLEQMEKYQSPVKSFSIDLDSFINSLESQVFNGRLQIGEEVIIKSNKLNMEYRSIILGYNVDFESGHFELNISDNLDDISALDKLASIIYKAESSSTILNNNKYKWDGITNVVDEVSQWRDKEISTVENRITAGANESIVIDNRGIQAHNPDFPDERLIMQSGVIALSKDGGKTWNTSITPDGVIAETIIGKLFAGNNLIITNESGSFVIDSTGLNVNMDSIKIMSGSESNPKDMIDLWNNLLLTYEEILDDGLITQHEKNQLQKQWNTIVDINSSMLEVFEKAWKDLEDSEPADSPKPKPKPKEYNDYILAYSELDKYLNVTIQSDGYAILDKDNREETTQVDSIVFAQKFKNYNEKKTIFESIIPLEFSNGKIEVLENGISLTYTKNSEIVTMLNLSEEGVRIDGKLLEINSRTEFNADLVMNAGVIKGADGGIIIDLNEGTIELNKPIKIGLGSNLVTKDDLEVLELEAYTVVLSNDNSFITTDKDGNNGDFSHAVSTVTVYKGATDDTSNWNITAVKSNGVVGALSGRTYTVTNMVGDSGKVIFTATHKSNSELSISKDFNIIKTKAGLDGEDGKIKNINLVSDGYVISYKGEQPLPAKQTIKMQAFTDGLEGIAVWEIVPYKNNIAQSPITKSVVNNTIEINELDFANSVDMIKVKITCDGLIDTATIVKIRNGLDGNSGKDGIAGKDGVGLKNTVIEYAQSTSGITKPTSGWSINIPTVTSGNYLWTKTTWTYTDSTSETGYTVSRIGKDGMKGDDGIAGKDGVGLQSTKIEYIGSNNGVTKPTTGWTTIIPSVPKGQFLWTRTTWTYTDNTTEYGYSVAKMGEDGQDGQDGEDSITGLLTNESITLSANSSGQVLNYVGASGEMVVYDGVNRVLTGVTYSVVSPKDITVTIGVDGKFSVSAMTSGTTVRSGIATIRAVYKNITIDKILSVTKALQGVQGVQGNNGKDGVAGKDGVGISDTVIMYAQSTNGTTAPSAGWTETIPTVPSGSYLWTQTTWKYTDNTSEVGYTVSRIGKDGNTGKDGIAGKDGVGLQSTKVEYAHSTSGTTAPTTGWTLTVPTVPNGSFLWTRTIWTYTDKTTETGYSVSRIGNDGNDGIAGKDGVGVKTTTITYSQSTSGTTAPTSGWSTSVPTPLVKGQYLWTRTTWTYTDNSTEVGYTVSYNAKDGNTGKDGIAGKDGVGISGTKVEYVGSTSGTTKPASGWSTTIPTVAEGSFLWTKTTWTYTDNSTEIGYSVAKMGAKGATGATGASGKDGVAGKDGKGINSTVITYMTSTSGTTAPTTGWSATVPTLTKGQYLWTRTIWTYTDSTTETGYSVSYIAKDGNNGTNGIAGKDGVGIKSTAITYAGSTSGTVKPTSGWDTAVPTVAQGSFLWTRTIWTYTDNTTETGYSVARMGSNGANGATGATGASATSYWITASNNIIGKSQTGILSPTTITFTGYSKTGTANSALYAGRFIIQTSTNGTTYATKYTSSANQTAYTYTIPADTKFIKALFYQAGGTTVLLDEQTVPVVESAEGIEIGDRNLLPYKTMDEYSGGRLRSIEDKVEVSGSKITIKKALSDLVGFSINVSSFRGKELILSALSDNATLMTYYLFDNNNINQQSSGSLTLKDGVFTRIIEVPENATTLTLGVGRYPHPTTFTEYWLDEVQLRYGNKYIAWSPAPQDARTYKAWANSADGGEDFTRVYPNENLFLESYSSYESASYAYRDINPELGDMVGKVYDKDTSVSMTGVYFGFTEVGVNGDTGVNWLMANGVLQGNASTTGIKSKRRYFSFYPKYEATLNKIKSRFNIKIEVGSEPTIYTTNTADSLSGSVPKYVGFGPAKSDAPHEYEWIMNPEYAQALADEALAGKVDNDAEYENLKNMAEEVKDSYEKFVGENGEYKTEHKKLAERTTAVETDLGVYKQQINFVDTYMSAGNEGLIIGMKDSKGKPDTNAMQMLLSNKSLSFMDGGEVVAYFSGQSFHINRGAIVDSLQIGQHKITNLGNGHTVFQFTG